MSWTPDGKTIVYWVNGAQTNGDIWYVPSLEIRVCSIPANCRERTPPSIVSRRQVASPTSPTKPDVLKFISNRFLKTGEMADFH